MRTEGGWGFERLGGRIAGIFGKAAQGPCLTLGNGDTLLGTRVRRCQGGEALIPIVIVPKIDAIAAHGEIAHPEGVKAWDHN